MRTSPSHYETLEVDEGASPEEVRRSYLELARRLHPDRWIDASEEERAAAHERMQAVNEAWRVLGNAGRRIAYDQDRERVSLGAERATTVGDGFAFSTGSLFGDDIVVPNRATRLLRAIPWVVVVLVLGGIFVYTAYATAPGDEAARCVSLEGNDAVTVPCTQAGARHVQLEVHSVAQCPASTEPFQPAGSPLALCLEVPASTDGT
jgi:hypothetical protein